MLSFHYSLCSLVGLSAEVAWHLVLKQRGRSGEVLLGGSTVRKNLAAAHFIPIPCELNTVCRHIESHILFAIRPWTTTILYARFGVFRIFLCVFLSVFRVLVRKELWIKGTSRHLFRSLFLKARSYMYIKTVLNFRNR